MITTCVILYIMPYKERVFTAARVLSSWVKGVLWDAPKHDMVPHFEPEVFGRLFRANSTETQELNIGFQFYPEQYTCFTFITMGGQNPKLFITDPIERVAHLTKNLVVFCTEKDDFVLEISHLLDEE